MPLPNVTHMSLSCHVINPVLNEPYLTGGGGALILITKDGKPVARGTKIQNNLYKMKVSIHKPSASCSKKTVSTPQTFQATEPSQSWETWHKRYGHSVRPDGW